MPLLTGSPGSKAKAEAFFERGLGEAFAAMRATQHPDYPMTGYYAFKQAESDDDDTKGKAPDSIASTGLGDDARRVAHSGPLHYWYMANAY